VQPGWEIFLVDQDTHRDDLRSNVGRDKSAGYNLVLAAQRGDQAAFLEIAQDYEAVVIRVALNVGGSEDAAEQIYCQVFKDAFVSVNQLRSASSVFLWIYRILVRHCLEYCRRHPHLSESDCSQEDLKSRLRSAIRSLRPIEQLIFQLKHYQGLRIRTLAEIFDVTPKFVIKTLQDANTHLRRQLKADSSTLFPAESGASRALRWG
jgi:RNA polymerase sigma-70 factor (ECF subfamily)